MADLFDTEEQFENIKRSLSRSVSEALAVTGKKNRLIVRGVTVDDNLDPDDLKSQLEAKLGQKTWGVPLTVDIELQDARSGETIDRQKVKLLDIPKLTPRYSFIVNGSEFQISNQLRLKPGAYIRKRRTGETEAFINLERGRNFRVELRPKKNQIVAEIGSANVNVYSLFHILGLKDKEIQVALGEDLHSAIVTPNVDVDILKLHNSLFRAKETNVNKALSTLRDYFKETRISPETTKATLGRSFTTVNGDMMLRTVKKLVAVNKGDMEPDNRDEIRFKKLFTPDDLLEQRISKNVRLIQSRIRQRLDSATEVRDAIVPRQISKLIYAGRGENAAGSFYNSSSLSNSPDQTNPVDFLAGFTKVTYLGEGGILDRHAITLPSRNINPTQIGFLDPVHTPENSDIGVVNHLPFGVVKRKGEMKTRVQERSGKTTTLSSHEAYDQTIALPGELDEKWKGINADRVSAYRGGKVVDVDPKEVTHRFTSATDLYGVSTNLVPFMSANSGARVMMGAKMMTQALPLVDREAPLVQARLSGEMSSDHAIGQEFSIHAPVSGEIVSAEDGVIKIKDSDGDVHDVQYYHNFPLNGDVGMTSDLKVAAGEKVKKGQLIGDTNFTKDGTLALGKNLRVAYLPYKGLTFEDGIVVSEAGAKKMTSEHLHRLEAPRIRSGGVGTIYDKGRFSSYYPTLFDSEQLEKLDDQGVVQVGQTVRPGDPIIAYMQEKQITPEDVAMGKLRKSLVKPFKNRSITWNFEDEGEVVRVAKTTEGPTVWVKTKEPIRIGDKLAGRHGNKGVVTCHDDKTEVLTDGGWKLFKDLNGEERVCTLNPSTREIEYHKPTAYINELYKGKMYRYAGRRLDLFTTPNHKHFVRTRRGGFRLEEAESCFGNPRIHLRTGLWKGTDLDVIEIPALPPLPNRHHKYLEKGEYDADAFMAFFGYWITEGCATQSKVHIGQRKSVNPDIYDDIVQAVRDLGYEPWTYDDVIGFGDVRLSTWLSTLGHSKTKRIPKAFLEASPRQLRILADALFAGDGGVYYREKDNHTRYELYTSSKGLADDYQEIALKLGFSANIKPQVREDRGSIEYVVRWTLKEEVWVNNDNRFDNEEWVEYDGSIHCVEVPNHIVYVRRNGIPVWSGNSIVPNREMPHTKDGEPVDIIMDPHGIPSRINVGQVFETVAGKLAKAAKKPYLVDNFTERSYIDDLMAQLKGAKIKDTEILVDPMSEEALGEPLVGYQYIMKLRHSVRTKFAGRGTDKYTMDNRPSKGGESSAQSLDPLKMFSMLAHGAKANIREMSSYKAEDNPEFWLALQKKQALPAPKPTFAWEKFVNMMRASGINVKKEGDVIRPVPFTDDEVLALSSGKIEDAKYFRAKDLRPEVGGLFDPTITGGVGGGRWAHIPLTERMPNPVFEDAIRSLTGLTEADFDNVVAGRITVDGEGNLIR